MILAKVLKTMVMNKQKQVKRKVLMKVDLSGTVNQLDVGESIVLKSREAKNTTIKTTVGNINKKGVKNFKVTEAGMIDSTLIIRLK